MINFIKKRAFIFITLLIGSFISSLFLSGITGNIWDLIMMTTIIFTPLFVLYLYMPFAPIIGFLPLSYFWFYRFVSLCEGRNCGDFSGIVMMAVLAFFFVFLFFMLLLDIFYQKYLRTPSSNESTSISLGVRIFIWLLILIPFIWGMTTLIQRKISSDRIDKLTQERREKWRQGQIRSECERSSFINGYEDARLNYENCLKKNGMQI